MARFSSSADSASSSLWSPEFVLLFFLSMAANSCVAIFYSFEHWLAVEGLSPTWRGVLLSAMPVMFVLMRPRISIWLMRHRGFLLLGLAIFANSALMCGYALLTRHPDPWSLLLLRVAQGVALAVFSTTVTALLVDCIPKGQSASGFAFFSLATLLPFSIIPMLSEGLLSLVGGEPRLYAWTSGLGFGALIVLAFLARRFKDRVLILPKPSQDLSLRHSLGHSGIGLLFIAAGLFSACTSTVVAFIKGLCTQVGTNAGAFFMAYTVTVMVTRLTISKRLDTLPRLQVLMISCLGLGLAAWGFALAPGALLTLAPAYGLCLGLVYPLTASAIYEGSSEDDRSINANIMMLAFDVGGITAPLLGGSLLQLNLGYKGVFIGAGSLMLLAALSVYRQAARRKFA